MLYSASVVALALHAACRTLSARNKSACLLRRKIFFQVYGDGRIMRTFLMLSVRVQNLLTICTTEVLFHSHGVVPLDMRRDPWPMNDEGCVNCHNSSNASCPLRMVSVVEQGVQAEHGGEQQAEGRGTKASKGSKATSKSSAKKAQEEPPAPTPAKREDVVFDVTDKNLQQVTSNPYTYRRQSEQELYSSFFFTGQYSSLIGCLRFP